MVLTEFLYVPINMLKYTVHTRKERCGNCLQELRDKSERLDFHKKLESWGYSSVAQPPVWQAKGPVFNSWYKKTKKKERKK